MPFAKADVNINRKGRVTRDKTEGVKILTNRSLKDKELLSLVRKLKPLLSESIGTAAKIMRMEDASHQNQLKAAVILLNAYKDTMLELYGQADDGADGAEEIQPSGAQVSFFYKPEVVEGGKE